MDLDGSNSTTTDLQLTVGSSIFNALILDNPTVSAFHSLLLLNVRMSELNGNEKHADLPTTLPTVLAAPGPIKVGGLMLYGSRMLVLWYEDYSTTYIYIRIGAVKNSDGLTEEILRLNEYNLAICWYIAYSYNIQIGSCDEFKMGNFLLT